MYIKKSTIFSIEWFAGNLIYQNTDVIVNPANVRLQHRRGAAQDIAQAAGPKLIKECKRYIEKNGELKTAQVFCTSAGNLAPPIRHVLHVAGPDGRHTKNMSECSSLLADAFLNCLKYASDILKCSSISLPAISAGRLFFGLPLNHWLFFQICRAVCF